MCRRGFPTDVRLAPNPPGSAAPSAIAHRPQGRYRPVPDPILSKAPVTKTPDGFELDRHIDSLGDGFVMAFMEGLVNAINRENDELWNYTKSLRI